MKTIGTDASLEECKKMGYLMLETDGNKFNSDKSYRFFAHNPKDICDESDGVYSNENLMLDTFAGLPYVLSRYKQYKEQIDECSGRSHSLNPKDYDYGTFLLLADDVNDYIGLG